MENVSYPSRRGVLRPLMSAQWQPLRGLHSGFLVAWVSGLWLLQLIQHPGWLIAIGAVYVILVVPALAGRDVIDGTEEFSFSLPPGRQALFCARLMIGLGFLGLLSGGGTLAVGYDLPQAFWSLFASSGVTEPNELIDPVLLYPLAFLAPACAFAVTFAVASLAGSRGLVAISWLAGLIAAGALTALGWGLEELIWEEPIGWLLCPILLLATVLILVGSSHAYANKEAVTGGGRVSGGSRSVVAVVVLLALGALLIVSFFLVRDDRTRSQENAMRIQEERASAAEAEALRDAREAIPSRVSEDGSEATIPSPETESRKNE